VTTPLETGGHRSFERKRGRTLVTGIGTFLPLVILLAGFLSIARAQETSPPVSLPSKDHLDSKLIARGSAPPAASETVALTVVKETPLQVALEKEVRVQKVGQPIHGRIVEPVYAFDRLVIPVGTKVEGEITTIHSVSGGKRTAAALDANFTPARKLEVEFTKLVMADGKEIPIHTVVTPGSGEPLQFTTAADDKTQKNGVKDAAAQKTKEAKEQARLDWEIAMQQVNSPGKLHRIGHYALQQLPVHPQYIEAGTVYFAELEEPLEFGSEPLTPQVAASIGGPPPDGTVVHTRLMQTVSSATAHKGDDVEAMVSQPLFDGDRLLVPQGTMLRGTVVQVEPARHLSRNGELRFVFREFVLPNGVEAKVNALLQGVQAARADNLQLDSEGGAQANSSNWRFLETGVTVGLAGFAMIGDSGGGDIAHSSAGGAAGYKLIGLALGLAVHSQTMGMALGAFGATRSIYVNFVARGRDLVFPKNTAMQIGIATRAQAPADSAPTSTAPAPARN
jgi:hypothetical protein